MKPLSFDYGDVIQHPVEVGSKGNRINEAYIQILNELGRDKIINCWAIVNDQVYLETMK